MREAGLPQMFADDRGERALYAGSKGVVRAVYPDRWRVDLETDDGSLLTEVLVVGPYLPQLHQDGADPSHVGYLYVRGGPDAVCWPMPHRRLVGPHDQPGDEQPERRYFHRHSYIFRSGDITVRITDDQRFVIESEHGDYIVYDQNRREIRLHAPTVYVGTTTDAGRIEYLQDTIMRAFTPVILLGTETQDRIEYHDGTHILLQAPVIKLTATEAIILDPPNIRFGSDIATERIVLGDTLQAYINAVVKTMIDAHVHSGVQVGLGNTGTPTSSFPVMPDTTLSTIARISE